MSEDMHDLLHAPKSWDEVAMRKLRKGNHPLQQQIAVLSARIEKLEAVAKYAAICRQAFATRANIILANAMVEMDQALRDLDAEEGT